MPARVVVVGDAVLDVTVAPSEPIRHGGDVPGTVRLGPGGQGANVAVRLARQGIHTELVCALADDVAGRHVRAALEAESVTLVELGADSTGAVAILLDDAGERSMVSRRPGLVRALGRADVAGLVAGADWLVVSGYVLLEDGAGGVAARLAGVPIRRVALGCELGREAAGWLRALGALRPDLVILNRDEARAATRDAQMAMPADADLATHVAGRVGCGVIVTERGRASAAADAIRIAVERTGRDERATDATGAGDAFAAAVIARLEPERWPPAEDALRRALEAALRAAADVVAVPGAQGLTAGERTAAAT